MFNSSINRRDAILASAGLVVAATMSSAASAQSTALTEIEPGVVVSPEDAAGIWAAMDMYMDNYRQPLEPHIDKHLASLHFPHVRIASHQVLVLPDAQTYKDIASKSEDFMQAGWDHSEWVTRKIIQADAGKAHVPVTFNRYTKDNTVINLETSFYIMEKIDGRWGVRGRSSFAK